MAPAKWSNLHPDILTIIAKILNSDVDILRLRSVCSSWRSSVPPRMRPSSFPLKVPPLLPDCQYHLLNYSTIYRLSPSKFGPFAGDPSDGWLIRVLEVNPNRFTFLSPLSPNKVPFPPSTTPKYLNLLHYRISEVCKCYSLNRITDKSFKSEAQKFIVKKVMVIWNYSVDCDFVVFVLLWDEWMLYWKFGDKEWTPVDTTAYHITDMVVSEGKCHAIGIEGLLVSFDSEFNLTVVRLPSPVSYRLGENFLVDYKSDLYLLSKIYEPGERCDEKPGVEIPFELKIFKKSNKWKRIRSLGNEMLVSCDDFSVGLSVEDFKGRKGNCVYLGQMDFPTYSYCLANRTIYNVYDLDKRTTLGLKAVQDCDLMYWPPPRWLMSG